MGQAVCVVGMSDTDLLKGLFTISLISLEVQSPSDSLVKSKPICVALAGNPNAGKTTLFNALTGLRAKTANFPGTTVEWRSGRVTMGGQVVELLDLPGLYSLAATTPEEQVARDALDGKAAGQTKPTAIVLIVDATNLERNLYLVSQILELDIPTIVALNMVDLAQKKGIHIETDELARQLGCSVVPITARTGWGVDQLRREVELIVKQATPERVSPSVPLPTAACACAGCPFQARYEWAESIGARCTTGQTTSSGSRTEKIDLVLTHPVVGVAAFFSVMFAVFAMIFWIAQYPMDWIDGLFTHAGTFVSQVIPEGDLQSLLVEGVIGGVGGLLVFLPQICILFFCLSLLEDTGYLARAAFVMDRLMRCVGLPGKAFVPLLSAHACAIPAIMSARVIEDKRDRLVTILVAPLMTCSARIPVYAMVTALLFRHEPIKAAMLFTAAYGLGIVAALAVAFVLKRTILKGDSKPLVLELPSYKLPSVRNAFVMMIDRAKLFIKKAGTVILAISIILWMLSTYPKSQPPLELVEMVRTAHNLESQGQTQLAATMQKQANRAISRHALSNSAAGRIGRFIEPVIRPLGFDWRIGVGVISSFAAREVIVSTLSVVYGVGRDVADESPQTFYDTLRTAQRSDGSPVFTTATCVSLLVFYVLAMQCLPTQVVTKRETNSWRWPIFQLVYMTSLAYFASFIAYQMTSVWVGGA